MFTRKCEALAQSNSVSIQSLKEGAWNNKTNFTLKVPKKTDRFKVSGNGYDASISTNRWPEEKLWRTFTQHLVIRRLDLCWMRGYLWFVRSIRRLWFEMNRKYCVNHWKENCCSNMKGWILSGDIEEDFLCLRKRIYLEVESQQRSRLPLIQSPIRLS